MLENRKNLIITLADGNYIKQAKQLFSSVFYNAGWEGDYMLLTNNISLSDAHWFESRGILIYDSELLTNSLVGIKAYPSVLLSKFNIFRADFKKWQKIIFLDADIIVKASLNNLLELDGFNAPIATTFRLKNEFKKEGQEFENLKKKYNLHRSAFNSGVFVFDTDLITNTTFNEIMSLHDQYNNICDFGDESVFNLFFYDKWKQLSMVYNSAPDYLYQFYGIKKNNLLAFVIHFVCSLKPWDSRSPYFQEWSDNFNKANFIDLSNRPRASRVISNQELKKYLRYLKFKRIMYFYEQVLIFINNQIGSLGLFIKKKNPKLYNLIRIKKDE